MSAGLPLPRRYWAILAISFGNAVVIIDGSIAAIALPTLARDLHVPNSAAVLVITTYQLVLVMALLPFANLGDRLGHRRLYQAGLITFATGSLLCFFAKSLPFLLVIRCVQAIGAAATLSLSSALLRSIYPSSQLGRGMGVNSIVVSCSAAMAPILGGLILTVAPWPWIFATAVPFVLLSLAFGRALPDPKPHDKPFDVLGAVLCAVTFGLIVSGAESGVHGDSPVISAAIVIAGLVIGFFFVRREIGEPRPILPVDLLTRPGLGLSVLASFIGYVALMSLLIYLPFHLQEAYGFSPAKVGAVLAPWPLAFTFLSPVAGALSDRIAAGILGSIGMAVAAVALVLLAFLPPQPTYLDIVWRITLCGAGLAFFFSPNARMIIGSTPLARASAAGGLMSTNRAVGQTAGATLVAALLAIGLGGTSAPFLVSAGLCVVACACSAARLRPTLRNPRPEEVEDI